jgi:hypothetical protein
MSVLLDGYAASPDGSTDWLAAGRSDDSTSWVLETVSNAGAHVIGPPPNDRPRRIQLTSWRALKPCLATEHDAPPARGEAADEPPTDG